MSIHQIYFLQRSDGLIKIGTTRSFASRLAQLTAEHGMLGIIRIINGDVRRERSIHRKFKRFHEYGEWFRPEKGALIRLIDALPDGEVVEASKSSVKLEWEEGEAAFMESLRDKIAAMSKTRSERTGVNRKAALAAINAEHGFSKFFLDHVRSGRATTVSGYGVQRINAAYNAELLASLDFYRAEVSRLIAEGVSDVELAGIGAEIDAITTEFDRRRKSRAAATAEIEARKALK